MFVIWGYDEAFFVNIRHEDRYRPEWFDKVERMYVREETLLKRYGVETLDEAQLAKDMYVPIPVLYERDVLMDFRREMGIEHPADDRHAPLSRENGENPYAENREALAQAWEEYRNRRVEKLIWDWAFENRIEEVVVGWRLYPAMYHTFLRNIQENRETHRKIKQVVAQTEWVYKRYRQPFLRTQDNRVIDLGWLLDALALAKDEQSARRIFEANNADCAALILPGCRKCWWEDCAKVLCLLSDETLIKHLPALTEWLQDMNWPGAELIAQRIKTLPRESVYTAWQESRKRAADAQDESWLEALDAELGNLFSENA